jgi:hypothetical protein
MKNIILLRLLIATLIILFSGFVSAYADGTTQEENKGQIYATVQSLNKINLDEVFCEKNPNLVFIILDENGRIIQQGRCGDVMVKYFLKISDPLLQIDNTRYYRLAYDNNNLMGNKLALKHGQTLKD